MEVTTYLLADVAAKRRFRSLATHADGNATRSGMAIGDRQDDFGVARPTLSGCADDGQGWVLLSNHLTHDPPGLKKAERHEWDACKLRATGRFAAYARIAPSSLYFSPTQFA